mgnify:CR=1 FL=1
MKEKKIKHHALTIDNDYIESEISKSVDFTDKSDVFEYEEKQALIKKSIANGNLEYAMHQVDEALMDIVGEVGARFVEELLFELEILDKEER